MTQALLNNLNITKDSRFGLKDSSVKAAADDFEKILDLKANVKKPAEDDNKTATSFENTDTSKTNTMTSQTQEQPQENKTNEKTNEQSTKQVNKCEHTPVNAKEENTKTIGDIKNKTNQKVLVEEIKNTILENAAESVIDIIIGNDTDADADAETEAEAGKVSSETNKKVISEEETKDENTQNENTQETNITEEDSTMYKELDAPENPTTVLLLSQIQTNVKLPASDKSEPAEQEITYTFTNDSKTETEIPKQFESVLVSKELPVVNNGAKEAGNTRTEQPKQNAVLNEKIVKELNIESVNAENVQNSASGDLMQNQSPQEQTVKIMIQGDLKTDVKIEVAKTVDIKPVTLSPEKIIEQISKQLEGMYNNSKLSMVLNPGTLGKLHLHLMNTKDGLIAQFTVTTQEAKDILMKGLNGLKDALLAHGINVDNVSVKLEDTESEEGYDPMEQDDSNGGNKQQGTRKQKEQKKPFEQMMFEIENDDTLV